MLLFLISCNSGDEYIAGHYSVGNLGDGSVRWLKYNVPESLASQGVVRAVDSLGYNDQYIIARNTFEEYYLIKYVSNDSKFLDTKTVLGPMSLDSFLIVKSDLLINNLEFSKHW